VVVSDIASPANAITALIGINFIAFAAFGIDKMKAEVGRWRISESTMLVLALFGGSPGAYAGRAAFRHKTRKQPFGGQLHGIAALQVFVLAIGGGWLAVG
jgi:uncharacterized membrane protein YsdA (DUF1294 family)